jgi:hypothetical protein
MAAISRHAVCIADGPSAAYCDDPRGHHNIAVSRPAALMVPHDAARNSCGSMMRRKLQGGKAASAISSRIMRQSRMNAVRMRPQKHRRWLLWPLMRPRKGGGPAANRPRMRPYFLTIYDCGK